MILLQFLKKKLESAQWFSDALKQRENTLLNTMNCIMELQTDFFKWGDCDTVVLQFTVFSNDSYSYFNSLQEHSENGESGIFGGEIIPVYSNVEQGLGVLISANAQNLFLKP
jgi:hypothetical protein